MMRDFSVCPKPSNKKAKYYCIGCFITAAGLVLASILVEQYRSIVGLGALAAITAALFIYTKYISSKYYYDVLTPDGACPLFVVRQQTGKRVTTLCRLELHKIVKIEPENAKQRKEHRPQKGYVTYTYIPTLSPDRVYRITYSSRYEHSEVVIEVSDEFAEVLRGCIAEAKELVLEDDD